MGHPAALVTGAARRLGKAIALHLASQGYDVILHCHHSRAEAEALLPVIESFARRGWVLQADLSDTQQALSMFAKAQAEFPDLNLLVNSASVYYPLDFLATRPEQFEQFYALHVKTPFFLTQAFAQTCGTGLVVNMTDAQAPRPDYFAYSLSKQNLSDFTQLAARALGPAIRVNAIAPGYILPPVEGNPDNAASLRSQIPLERTGSVSEITQALQVLIDHPYLTGQTLYVDGGLHLV
ncbi:hypothetical protein COW36_18010 [bacterium (Candidatus Blackallbacteria) CG17_big_fil_post_rev_8_21_14_2_50_48_46]|uniref:Short-chain dehydrogenase n=1 Tax=bacterium (Candidatus Blackallbacteria) CG17_big_fil_post_rev_8_21_14_2_50_48_46 TaxID=2014261 RepID=A0A2M7G0T4_9BACT|nr:MAG: hypothetical protein COW64_00715 [bacterium (Candidatus Blackallbacteria) CG18_big_fil_WC_8_21_14_2_50_49_26]PIW15311.1 MAG: hypothetical protein COW36_18010 [bacterium (Candidatus Blackallbacteria) CG17_big_fil_post_rev_8_21_14_2_50_48_46]PIW45179.1 MAG: hypothetical protein COW20_21005 [bacterium (Candidatus Blackallbacteria) CG13_big_fil_rev_8_21_14_2_50_49_14]